jgi:ABC-2 type transport system ATP-binding protein
MNSLTINNVAKHFGPIEAVVDLSFEVRPGEIFAILGPNGAGKTTMIRMVLDILRPDRGSIDVFGGPISQAAKDRIGYLPEERGLYKNLTVLNCLTYLGRLKGMKAAPARQRAEELIHRVDLADAIDKKVSQLSRGMQQKAQFAATIIHDPDLIVIDEPFSGLDPVNTLLIKELIFEMRQQGKTIIMSTHMMHQVEAMAGRMLMINKGRKVLYGPVEEIRQQYADHAVYIGGAGNWETMPFAERVTFDEDERASLVMLRQGVTSDDAFRMIAQQPDLHVDRFEVALPSLDDIFINVVEGERRISSNGKNGKGR